MSVTTQSTSRSERAGRWLAGVWKVLLRQEIRLAHWMVAQGLPAWLTATVLWVLKVALIVTVGYAVFWLAVVLAVIFVAVAILRHADLDSESYALELRDGLQGFGHYNRNGDRVISYDPTEDP